jgi:C-terminal peptidase prc
MQRKRLLLLLLLLLLVMLSCKAVQPGRLIGAPAATLETPAQVALTPPPSATPVPQQASSTPAPPPATPTPPVSPTPPASPTPDETPSASPASSPFQTQVFEQIWSIVNENYIYPDFNGLDWQTVRQEYLAKIEAGLSDDAFYQAMDEMINRLGDEHSTYFSPEEARRIDEEYAGRYDYVGIGVMTTFVEESQQLAVISLFADSPAEQAGLQLHDRLIAVDGQPLVDSQGPHHELLRGPQGSSITLTVQTPGEAPRQIPLVRQRIDGGLRVPYQVLLSKSGKRIGYLQLVTFNDQTIGDKVGQALEEMSTEAPLDGLIIDNRFNGGGSSVVLEDTLSLFTDGRLGYFVDRQGERPLEVNGRDLYGSSQLPLVVMVGPGTASFGEIFAGVLQDTQRATLIGEITGGNVEVLSIYKFQDGSRAWIARETFRPLNQPDANWETSGIVPNLIIPAPWDAYTLETDPAVQAGLTNFD